ncbi:hypothetical protein BDZ89DRAFT_1070712 [Hymenopellis radicata]|nr:hypothetical protein BDZ89DRAFT_1070712 [Hymenopellis radicata]
MPITRPTTRVDLAGYCFNAEVLVKWAQHVLEGPMGRISTAYRMLCSTCPKSPRAREELTVEALENMISPRASIFRGLPNIEEGPWEARVREVLIKKVCLSPNDFYFARRLTGM